MPMLTVTLSTLIALSNPGTQPPAGHSTMPHGTTAGAAAAAKSAAPISGPEAELAALDDKWAEAAASENLEALTSLYADDAILMDPGVMKVKGKDDIKKLFTTMFTGLDNIKIEFSERSYRVAGNVGYGSSLWVFSARDAKSGQPTTSQGRASFVAEKKGGKWVLVLDHASIPSTTASPAPNPGNTVMPPGK